jgi:dTDP-4-amino-4,6-dideoxygalactose transaminase
MDPEKINESITNSTCAIQVIHLAGNPCDMKQIMEIAEDHSLVVIEDCAQALGAEYMDKKIGSFGDVSCFTFTKNLYGFGGMITTNDESFFSVVNDYSRKLPKLYIHPLTNYIKFVSNSIGDLAMCLCIPRYVFRGIKKSVEKEQDVYRRYLRNTKFLRRPTKIEASITLPQFRILHKLLEKRVENALFLSKELGKNRGIKQQIPTRCSTHVYTKYMIETKYSCIDIIKKLRESGVEAMHLTTSSEVYQQRFDRDPIYSHFKSIEKCENYLKVHDHIVCLPISSNMTKEEMMFISKKVNEIIDKRG